MDTIFKFIVILFWIYGIDVDGGFVRKASYINVYGVLYFIWHLKEITI